MNDHINFLNLRTSWTKYDIVQVLDVPYSLETIERYMRKEISIDEPILRSFLGVENLNSPIPDYWKEIQKYSDKEKKIFSLLTLIFTHGGVVEEFASKYSTGNMKGVFRLENGKQYTNLRSALVVSGAAEPIHRKSKEVPYDFSVALYNVNIGKLFKQVLLQRFSLFRNEVLETDSFYKECFRNKFHSALGLTKEQFKNWLEGVSFEGNYIKQILVEDFFSIKNASLDFDNSKEVYFLGENGDGKSLLLMALYLAFNGNFIATKTELEETGRAVDILSVNRDMKISGEDEQGQRYNQEQANYIKNLYAYGVHRGRYSSDNPEKYGFMSLFDINQTLMDPIAWLNKLRLDNIKEGLSQNNGQINTLVELLRSLIYELLERNVSIEFEGAEIFFKEKEYKLTFDQLSEGYRSIIIFVCDLLFRLSKNGQKYDMTSFKGVVIVDEIDLHLHPKWQRVIVKRLRSSFPNLQFFFTTHSPTIILGASNDAIIYRVYRDSGETKISEPYYRKELNHLMMNTLLTSSLFGLDNSRLDEANNNSNTDDTYLLYRINEQTKRRLSIQYQEGKNFLGEKEIDDIIAQVINEELNDKKK